MGLVTILQFNLDDNYLTEGTVVYSSGKDGHPLFIRHVVIYLFIRHVDSISWTHDKFRVLLEQFIWNIVKLDSIIHFTFEGHNFQIVVPIKNFGTRASLRN